MFSNYFAEVTKKIKPKKASTKKTSKKTTSKKTTKKPSAAEKTDIRGIIADIIPAYFNVDSHDILNTDKLRSNDADLIIYHNYLNKTAEIFDNAVPAELVHAALLQGSSLTDKVLIDTIEKAMTIKAVSLKNDLDESVPTIPVIAFFEKSSRGLGELKESLITYYLDHNTDPDRELDLIVVQGKGVLIRNWREKRSYIGLEMEEDTMMWFFVLLNEFLELRKGIPIDLRNYVATDRIYTEY